jgi:hypothetical protein
VFTPSGPRSLVGDLAAHIVTKTEISEISFILQKYPLWSEGRRHGEVRCVNPSKREALLLTRGNRGPEH